MKVDKKSLILKFISKNSETTSNEISNATGATLTYINRILNDLIDEGVIKRIGFTNNVKYIHVGNSYEDRNFIRKTFLISRNLSDNYPFEFIKNESEIFKDVKDNVIHIIDYVLSEMVNNTIDHSKGNKFLVIVKKRNKEIEISIKDDGVGALQNIKDKFSYSIDDAALHIMKGKLTTSKEFHSGQGIFFSSKPVKIFHLYANGRKIVFINNALEQDVYIKHIKEDKGTKIFFKMDLDSKKELRDIFKKYSDEDFEFSKTSTIIHLYKHKDDLISRSEAKRLLIGLEKFKTITLDFKEVDIVGQAFCDEVFRVWQNRFPKVKFEVINANIDIMFMIDRVEK